MASNIEKSLEKLSGLFALVDEALLSWESKKNLQIPELLKMIAIRENWTEKQMREADPLIRYYVRNHPEFYVTRGAHGGIQHIKVKKEREEIEAIKAVLKDEMKTELEIK